jgi:hypothetical protein
MLVRKWRVQMSIQISTETEARLTEEAQRQGISVDELLEALMHRGGVLAIQAEAIEHALALVADGNVTPELPILHLGSMGVLHRRDIYDDVR